MPDEKKLKEALATLRAELDRLDEADPEIQRRLQSAIAEIEVALGQRSASSVDEEEESIQERLVAAMRHYEETHPTLSGMVGSVIDTLSRMGI